MQKIQKYNREDLLGVRVRFAPSPTGPLHAGNMRTAVFNWLFARSQKGKFILRIDDTDKERNKLEYAEEIIESLKWLGLDWDEGPFYQSRHTTAFNMKLEQLATNGCLYPCFCSEEKLEADRNAAAREGRPPVYSGICRDLPLHERNSRALNEPFALRFRIEDKKLKYFDIIRGEVNVSLELLGDFIVFRSNGLPTYNFANAVDDGMMNITHVIRGEDHISNTPIQIMLLNALGFRRPVYAHLPLIMAEDGSKLGKRDARSGFSRIINEGYLPEAALNFLALIGWSPEDKNEEMTAQKLIEKFSLKRVAVRLSSYNLQKLEWFNTQKIKKSSPENLLKLGGWFIKKYQKEFGELAESRKLLLIDAVKDNIGRLTDLDYELAPFFDFEVEPAVREAMAENSAALAVIKTFMENCHAEDFQQAADEVSKAAGVSGKQLFMPIRAALTGRLRGPELKKIYEFLKPDERVKRLERFLEFLKG
ncbi:MAG: glutamate--tRNA ligase [bacterium]|nr:MAG: glutamate--tRNA ligase [bacterium]